MSGEIVPQGAKNEALEVICATLLTPEKVTIHNVPDILDVNNLIQLLRDMRVKVEHPSADTYTFQADDVDMEYLSTEEFLRKSGSLRGSVMIVGPLVARFGRALIPKPGGDKIGRRRLDTHFVGIQKLGACFSYDAGRQVYEIEARQLKGAYMLLDEASVTGTANILMAAVLAEGVTTIYNAACEPYLQQLSTMLNRMGARISGVGSNLLTIEGVRSLSGTEHTILPDMIEVGSFIGMAAMTGSVLVPSALIAAISKAIPARISGDTIVEPRNLKRLPSPITVARCGSQRMIWAPISISLSTKNKRLSNIFWWISTLPTDCVATTRNTLSKSGVSPGQGASAMVMIEPSINVSIS